MAKGKGKKHKAYFGAYESLGTREKNRLAKLNRHLKKFSKDTSAKVALARIDKPYCRLKTKVRKGRSDRATGLVEVGQDAKGRPIYKYIADRTFANGHPVNELIKSKSRYSIYKLGLRFKTEDAYILARQKKMGA